VKQNANPEEYQQNVNPEEYVEYNSEDLQNEIVQSSKKFQREQGLEMNVISKEENDNTTDSTESTTKKAVASTSELIVDGTEREPWHLDDLTETLVRYIKIIFRLLQNMPNCILQCSP